MDSNAQVLRDPTSWQARNRFRRLHAKGRKGSSDWYGERNGGAGEKWPIGQINYAQQAEQRIGSALTRPPTFGSQRSVCERISNTEVTLP